MRLNPSTALAGALCLGAAVPANASPIDWHLYDASCAGGAAAVQIACGNYGRFLVLQSQAPPGCSVVASGVEDPPAYPHVLTGHAFPIRAPRLSEIGPQPAPAPHARMAASASASATTPPIDSWIAVVDFDSAHGESTTWLAGQMAGAAATAALAPLDDSGLDVLGPVGDFHVLAKLCEIVQSADGGSLPVPTTVNMSFGRPARETDPLSSTACPEQNAACQVASVVHYLKTRGATLVAAAGNRGKLLFPAVIDDVIASGMLDQTAFLEGLTRPAWETPSGAEGWIPGYALCLDSWPAPAGSSYSSAMLAGWLVKVLGHPDVLRQLGDGPWVPAWSTARGCYVLAKGKSLTPWCNATATALFAGLTGASADDCSRGLTEPNDSAPADGRAIPPDPLPSLDAWGDPTHPAPESDPCVPCEGTLLTSGSSSDLKIDLSQSGPLPSGIHLDSVSLRVGPSFYPISMSPSQLQGLEVGGLATLLLPGAGPLIPPIPSISLWYRLKANAGASCGTTACYWSSTPVLLEPK